MRATGTVRWLENVIDLLAIMIFSHRSAPSPPPVPVATSAIDNEAIIAAVNAERRRYFRNPVAADVSLDRFAANWVARMIQLGRCTHGDPGTADDFEARFAMWLTTGEHGDELIACGPTTAAEAVASWIGDPRTKGILLNPRHERLGVACDSNARGVLFWCGVLSD